MTPFQTLFIRHHSAIYKIGNFWTLGRGGGQEVSVLTFYSDDPSLNPAEAYCFSVQFVFEMNENKQKEAGVGPFLKKTFEPR